MEEIPGWMKTFELAMMVLTALCIAGVLLVVVLHLGFRGECQTLRVC